MTPTSDPSTLSDLPSVRAAIDELGMETVALLVRRQHLVHRAGELNAATSRSPAPDRAATVVNLARSRATTGGGSGQVIADIYRAMIDCFIRFERESRAPMQAAPCRP